MAGFPIHSSSPFHFLLLQFLTLISFSLSSLSFQTTLMNNPSFDPEIALLGDAKAVDINSHVQLVSPFASSSGLLIRNKPFKFIDPNCSKPMSFSTEFSFSISPDNGDGVAFVVFPYNSAFKFVGQGSFGFLSGKKYLGVEYDTRMDDSVGDSNANHVGINVNSVVSVITGNVSSVNLVLNNGEKLRSWIDYDSSSKRMEVRLSKFGERRPYHPIVAHHIDLLKMWGNEDVSVGIVSNNGNSKQIANVYSWNFRLRDVPYWLHSLPADPRANENGERFKGHKRSVCPLKFLAGLIFATGCGALLAFVVLFAWAIVNRHTEIPADYNVPPTDFKYEKIAVIVDEDREVVKH